jgi:hypothetical protein
MYQINNKSFKSKRAAENQARKILNINELDSRLNIEESSFTFDYFKLFHKYWDNKKGAGIDYILRKRSPNNWNNRNFWIYRLDGSNTDISFIIGRIGKRNFRYEFNLSMRVVINPQIQEFKAKTFANNIKLKCEVSGDSIELKNCHVDHYTPSFKELVDSFIEFNNLELKADLFPEDIDGQTIHSITNDDLSNSFYDYHKANANLRVLSAKANLSRSRV